MLPRVIRDFRQKYPDVQLHLHQGTSDQIAEMATLDRIDFAINTGSQDKFPDFVLLPIYSWHRQIIVPKDHPLGEDGEAHAAAARRISAGHLRVQLHRSVVAAAAVRARRPRAECRR